MDRTSERRVFRSAGHDGSLSPHRDSAFGVYAHDNVTDAREPSVYASCGNATRRLHQDGALRRRVGAMTLTIVCLLAMTLLGGCSTKKNTAMSRSWQAFTTRYNVYYNGDTHYKETLADMERTYQDDYSRMVLPHPADARANEKLPQPTGDYKRTLEKMQKAIQLHSIKKKPAKKSGSKKEKEFRARDEFNPFLHNAWLTMGRAQYMNGDFLGAAATFGYIYKHFTWLPDVVTEAMLWQARSYSALDWNYEAENVLHRVKPKMLTSKKLKNLYNLVQAGYLVRSEEYAQAVPYLRDAAAASSGSQKNRLYFLLGQVEERMGDKQKAYAAFKKAGAGINTDYRTKFNARIKQSEVFTGSDIRSEVRSLKSMARYGRNQEFLDQIYYAIGNLYISRKDTTEAKKYYALGIEKSTRNGIDKALVQLALGNIYFEEGDYVKAQPLYSEAVPQLNDGYPGYKTLKRRSDVLDELAVYSGNVQLQDSLLALSELSPEEQMKVCKRLAEELKKREKEEAEAAARAEAVEKANANAAQSNLNGNAPQNFVMNSDKSWYFYNNTSKNTGKTEFQRKWGARKLEDDWRRRNKNTFSFDEPEEQEGENPEGAEGEPTDSLSAEEKKVIEQQNDPHYPEYYLKQIPQTDEEKQTCNDVIQEGLYNMGIILKDKLEDFPAARKEFNELDERYPDNIYRLDVYYNMYLMAVRQDDVAEAEKWRQLIIQEFPESPYGQAMLDPNYFNNLRRMNVVQEELYAQAYDAYLNDDNSAVHRITEEVERDYPLSKIMPKFVFIDALSYVTSGDYEKFRERLEYLLQKWPQTDMTDMASSIVSQLKSGRKPNAGLSNTRGMLWDTRLTTSEAPETSADGQPANFERDPNSPQYLVYAFPRDSINANGLLYDVARFNFSSFVVKDFDLEQMSFGNVGLLIVKGFANVRELEHYRNVMAQSGFEVPEGVRPIMISKPNFELLLREGRSFEEYFRYEEGASMEAAEEQVLGAEEPAEGEEAAPAEANPDNPEEESAGPGGAPSDGFDEDAESTEENGTSETAPPAEATETAEPEATTDE